MIRRSCPKASGSPRRTDGPYYLILGPDEQPLVPGRGYNLDVQAFVDFLEEGLLNYRALK